MRVTKEGVNILYRRRDYTDWACAKWVYHTTTRCRSAYRDRNRKCCMAVVNGRIVLCVVSGFERTVNLERGKKLCIRNALQLKLPETWRNSSRLRATSNYKRKTNECMRLVFLCRKGHYQWYGWQSLHSLLTPAVAGRHLSYAHLKIFQYKCSKIFIVCREQFHDSTN